MRPQDATHTMMVMTDWFPTMRLPGGENGVHFNIDILERAAEALGQGLNLLLDNENMCSLISFSDARTLADNPLGENGHFVIRLYKRMGEPRLVYDPDTYREAEATNAVPTGHTVLDYAQGIANIPPAPPPPLGPVAAVDEGVRAFERATPRTGTRAPDDITDLLVRPVT